jgi:hypothetical protein
MSTPSTLEIRIPEDIAAYIKSISSGYGGDCYIIAACEKLYRRLSAHPAKGLRWISVADRKPDIIEGMDYSKNVLVICEDKLEVMRYCWVNGGDEENSGFIWANCYGDIHAEGEFDDEYHPAYWMPLPEIPAASPLEAPFKEETPFPDHVHVALPSGGVANVSPDASPELLDALDKMVELAKETPDSPSMLGEKEAAKFENVTSIYPAGVNITSGEYYPPADLMKWIKDNAKDFCRLPETKPDIVITSNKHSLAGLFAWHDGAKAMYNKLLTEKYGDLLSAANAKIASLEKERDDYQKALEEYAGTKMEGIAKRVLAKYPPNNQKIAK